MGSIFSNYPFMAGMTVWVLAIIIKTALKTIAIIGTKAEEGIKNEEPWMKLFFKNLRSSGYGGMPSIHTAPFVAVATALAIQEGFESAEFAVAMGIVIVVIYDALGLRRMTGEHAKRINFIFEELFEYRSWTNIKKGLALNKELREIVGHTPMEVTIGGALGVCVAVVLKFVFYPSIGAWL